MAEDDLTTYLESIHKSRPKIVLVNSPADSYRLVGTVEAVVRKCRRCHQRNGTRRKSSFGHKIYFSAEKRNCSQCGSELGLVHRRTHWAMTLSTSESRSLRTNQSGHFYGRDAMLARYYVRLGVCSFVCLSVTCRYCTETDERIKLFLTPVFVSFILRSML